MSALRLQSTKYDGSLHYRYPVRVVDRAEDRLITCAEPGTRVDCYRGSWTSRLHLLSVFWRDRPYVLHARWDNAWRPDVLYVDIAIGTDWRDGTVTYIDMDLDLILRHGSSTIQLDDEDEFEANRVRWRYPADLARRCRDAADEVHALLMSATPPFTPALFAWRPGTPFAPWDGPSLTR